MMKQLTYPETIRFHGHNGPFLALGYRLGRYIVKRLKPKGIMDLKITVKARLAKPYTCLIDGLQCATFATMGKCNISVRDTKDKGISVVVEKDKKRIKFRITRSTLDLCLNARDLDRTARVILKKRTSDLWEIGS